jgi:predicted TIM-barrel fold metal-dependent hydrolase
MARQPIIDADGHIIERQQDIKKYLAPPWDKRNTPLWPNGYPWDSDLFDSRVNPEYGRGGPPEEQVDTWLKVMERENIETAILFPTGSGHVQQILEPDYAIAVARAANDQFAKEYAARSDRLKPVGVLPLRDPQAAAKELNRAVTELGLVSFELLTSGLPTALGDPIYDPIYAEAERLGVPLCIHGTRSYSHEIGSDRFRTFTEVHCYSFPAYVMLHFTSIFFNAVPLRFPKLKLAFLEIGATWLPYYLDRMDEHWELRGEFEAPHLTMKPTDLFRESQVYVSLEAEEAFLPQTFDHLGDSHFLFASDFPHWDAEFPKNLEVLEARGDISEAIKRKLVYDNAKALFGL